MQELICKYINNYIIKLSWFRLIKDYYSKYIECFL